MIRIVTRELKSPKTLTSGGFIPAGSQIISHALLNQDGDEGRKIKEDALRGADADLAAAKRRGLKGKSLTDYNKAVKRAQEELDGRRFSGAELFLMVQGVHPVKLTPAEKGVLMAALKGLTVSDLSE